MKHGLVACPGVWRHWCGWNDLYLPRFYGLPIHDAAPRDNQHLTHVGFDRDAKMQLPAQRLIVLSAVLAFAFSFSAVEAARIRPSWHDGRSPHHCDRVENGHVFPFLKWLRDSVTEAVFGHSSGTAKDTTKPSKVSLQSRYQNDVVVRFNVTNSDEEGALSQAAEQMLLDVWTFTPEYVDIRLHKDDVSSLLTLLPASLQPSVLIPDMAAAVWATYPSKTAANIRFDATSSDPATLRTALDGLGNIFFRDYQPLSVSLPLTASRSPLGGHRGSCGATAD